jgi:hypothetical protein
MSFTYGISKHLIINFAFLYAACENTPPMCVFVCVSVCGVCASPCV